MKILMFSTYFPPHYSGAAKQGISLAQHLKKKGHHIEFITIRRASEAFEDEFEGFKVWRISMGKGKHQEFGFWLNFLWFMFKRRNNYDVLHSHGAYYLNSFIGVIGRLFGIKTIIKTSLADSDLKGVGKGLAGRLHHFFLKQIDAYIAISQELHEELESFRFPSEKIHFFPNGVDTDRFSPCSDSNRAFQKKQLGLSERQPIALCVGVFDKRKNIGWLINQWADNKGFGTGALLLAIGPQSREDTDGSFLAGLKNKAGNHPGFIKIKGQVNNIEHYFQVVDFFVLPSTNEGMPNVVLEAMACGLPCIATAVSGCTDLIREGKNGYTFTPLDSNGLKYALNSLSNSDKKKLGKYAREQVIQKFSLTALSEKYDTLYFKLCNNC